MIYYTHFHHHILPHLCFSHTLLCKLSILHLPDTILLPLEVAHTKPTSL